MIIKQVIEKKKNQLTFLNKINRVRRASIKNNKRV